jgi:hypothetical protein
MKKVVSLCKRRGFVFQSSEIYGGLKSAYDYGPLGAELWQGLFGDVGWSLLKFVATGVTAIVVWEVTLRVCDTILKAATQ